jgi:hypothetical protein
MYTDKKTTWFRILLLYILILFLTSCAGVKQGSTIKNDGSGEAMGYMFEGKGCRDSGGTVTCIISVKNKTNGLKVLSINATEGNIGPFRYYKTYLYDERGNQYLAEGESLGWVVWMRRIVSDLPWNVGISFKGMSIAQSKNVTLVIGCVDHRERNGIASSKEFSVTLRNVPVIR